MFQDTRGAFVSDVLTEMWMVIGMLLSKKKSYTSNSTCKQTVAYEPRIEMLEHKIPSQPGRGLLLPDLLHDNLTSLFQALDLAV